MIYPQVVFNVTCDQCGTTKQVIKEGNDAGCVTNDVEVLGFLDHHYRLDKPVKRDLRQQFCSDFCCDQWRMKHIGHLARR